MRLARRPRSRSSACGRGRRRRGGGASRGRLVVTAAAGDEQREHGEQQCGQRGRTSSHEKPPPGPGFPAMMTDDDASGLVALMLVVGAVRLRRQTATRCPVVVSAPVSTEPWIARSIERGAQLAVDEINADGGVQLEGRRKQQLKLVVLDNALLARRPRWPTPARRSSRHAAVLLTDGTGAVAVASVTDPAKLPVFVLFEGGAGLIDPAAPPDAVPPRSGRRDHDPPARRLHRQRRPEGRDADRRLRLRRAGPRRAARRLRGRRGARSSPTR